MSKTSHQHIKRVQPHGPYAITGYSLDTAVGFEVAELLESNGDEVAICGALNSPPHVTPLVQPLDWTAAAVLVSYFIELIPQAQMPELTKSLQGHSKTYIVKRLLEVARPFQRQKLSLDPEQLLAIVNVTDNFGSLAKVYQPEGHVGKVDVFYCTPLHSVEKDRASWLRDRLSRWQDFLRGQIELHECEGDHADMLNPTYVEGFKQRLVKVLKTRGV